MAARDQFDRASRNLRTMPDQAVESANRRLRASTLAAVASDTGGDRRLSGLVNGRPLTVKTVRRRNGTLVEGRVMAGPRDQRAPWFWMQEGTAPGPRGTRGSRRYRGNHPGTRGRRTWSKAVDRERQAVRNEIMRGFRAAIRG